MNLTHFSLFSGIGGIDLAAEWAGFETVGQCEFADYPTKVLEKHWPEVPRWRDIIDVTAESVRSKGITNITLLSGGFPCQPFSVAGKQRGKEDDRYLWPQMLRVIEELRPSWVLGENVAGLVRMALDQVLFDLESKDYTAIPLIIPACSVDAPHKRERVFIIAHTRCESEGSEVSRGDGEESSLYVTRLRQMVADSNGEWQPQSKGDDGEVGGRLSNGCKDVADSNSERQQRERCSRERRGNVTPRDHEMPCQGSCKTSNYCNMCSLWQSLCGKRPQEKSKNMQQGMPCGVWEAMRNETMESQWSTEPRIPRVANGIKNRVDRLKCLGNAVVPQQVYPILKAIADIERKFAL